MSVKKEDRQLAFIMEELKNKLNVPLEFKIE
jgi:hypothetical protein